MCLKLQIRANDLLEITSSESYIDAISFSLEAC